MAGAPERVAFQRRPGRCHRRVCRQEAGQRVSRRQWSGKVLAGQRMRMLIVYCLKGYGRPISDSLFFTMVLDDTFDLLSGTHDDRAALVQVGGLQLHDALGTGACQTTGLFDNETHRVAFVHQA